MPVKKKQCLYLATLCDHYQWKCSGVKTCERLHPELQAFEHIKVDDDLSKRLEGLTRSIREEFPRNGGQCYMIRSQNSRQTTCGKWHIVQLL